MQNTPQEDFRLGEIRAQNVQAAAVQGFGPWSEANYVNGMDLQSDQAYEARRQQEWIGQSDAIQGRRLHEQSLDVAQERFRATEREYRQATDTGAVIRPGDTLERVTSGDKEMMGRYARGMGLKDLNQLRVGQPMVADWDMSASDAVGATNRFYAADGQRKLAAAAQTSTLANSGQAGSLPDGWNMHDAHTAQQLQAARELEAQRGQRPVQYMSAHDPAADRARAESVRRLHNDIGLSAGGVLTGWAAGARLAGAPENVVENIAIAQVGLTTSFAGIQSRGISPVDVFPRNGVRVSTSNAFNALENPGPLASLPGRPAGNFYGGRYDSNVLHEDLVLYRAGEGTPGKELGQWFTRQAPQSIAQVRIDTAVKPQWIDGRTGVLTGQSNIDTVYAVVVPRGTTIYEGPVGTQGGIYVGGPMTNQIFVHQPWNVPGVKVIDSTPLR